MNNYFDFYKSIIENQKSMMDSFKGFTPQAPTSFSPADMMKQYENFVKQQQEFMNNANNFWGNMPQLTTDPLVAWQNAMNQLNPMEFAKKMGLEESQVFDKVLNANKFYLSMYNFYEDLKNHYVSPAAGELEKIAKDTSENFDNLFRESMLPLLPNELRPFVENPYDFGKTVVSVTSNFFSPWKENLPEMTEAILKSPLSKDSLTEYINLWRESYNQTVGALMKSPAVGSNREFIEQQNKAVDAAAEMLLSMVEFLGQISNVTSSQGKLSIEDWLKEVQENAEPKSFKEFYKYWTGKIEDELEKYFYTDEFAQLMGNTLDASMKFKIESNKLAERYLQDSVLVTKGQIDSLYKTVYDLKRELRTLKRELKESNKDQKEDKKEEKKSTSKSTKK